MREFALTYPQLVRQAMTAQLDERALLELRDTFSVAQRYFDGLYRASGEPFICHMVRTASILLYEDQPLPIVAAALVHATYDNFRYEHSTRLRPSPRLRRRVRRDVGTEVEALVWAFHELRWESIGAPELQLRALPGASTLVRSAVALHLANDLANHLDMGRAYLETRRFKPRIEFDGPSIIQAANDLGMPTVGRELAEAFDESLTHTVPAAAGRIREHGYEVPVSTTSRTRALTRFVDRVPPALRRRLRRRHVGTPRRPERVAPMEDHTSSRPPPTPRPRILVTGAAGRIGREIAPLLRQHFSLRLLDIEPIERTCDEDEIVRVDIRDSAALRLACRDVSAIVHLAIAASTEPDFTNRMMPVNIDGTYQVFEAARSSGVPRVVVASTGQVVGGYPVSEWVAADAPVRPSSLYACTKVFAEALARYYSECHGVAAICLRIGWFDSYGGDLVRSRPELRWMWSSPRDLAQLIVKSVQSNVRFAVLFAVSDNPRRQWDLDSARETVGYVPEDRASDELAPREAPRAR